MIFRIRFRRRAGVCFESAAILGLDFLSALSVLRGVATAECLARHRLVLLVVELSALYADDYSIVASRCDHHGMVVCQTVSWDLSITMFSLRRLWRRTERKKLLPQTYGAMPRSVGAKLVIGKNGGEGETVRREKLSYKFSSFLNHSS